VAEINIAPLNEKKVKKVLIPFGISLKISVQKDWKFLITIKYRKTVIFLALV